MFHFLARKMALVLQRPLLPLSGDPWERARTRFLDGLSPEEQESFNYATLEDLYYVASNVERKFHNGNYQKKI